MKIPIISEYFERKKAEAQAKLNQLREFYTYPDSYGWQKSIDGSEIFSDIDEKNSPTKSLRKKRKEFEKKYGGWELSGLMWNAENFHKLSEEEKRKWVYERMRSKREERAEKLFEKWCEDALPILENIIQQNPEGVNGLEYFDYAIAGNYGGTFGKRVNIMNGKIYTTSYDMCYGRKYDTREENVHEVASSILIQGRLEPGILRRYDGCYSKNMERNRIVEEIKKKSGRNLKNEVSELKKQRKKLLLDFLPTQPLSFWGGSNYF